MRPSLSNGYWLSCMNHRWNFSLSSRTKGLSIWQFLSRLPLSWDAYEFGSSTAFLLEVSARWAGAMFRVAGLYSLLKLELGLLVSKEASYTNLGRTEFCLLRGATTTYWLYPSSFDISFALHASVQTLHQWWTLWCDVILSYNSQFCLSA